MKLKLRGAVLAALVTVALTAPAWADCDTRHFYNNSDSPFSVYLKEGTCSFADSGMQHECTIPPNSVGELHYSNVQAYDWIYISSGGPSVYYGPKGFDVHMWPPGTCHIEHPDANTGNIAVNSDAEGDVKTCGPHHMDYGRNAGYPCQ